MGYKGNSNKAVSSSYLWTQMQNLYTKIKGLLSGKSDVGHTHNYAGSSSSGGSALDSDKLNGVSASGYMTNGYMSVSSLNEITASGTYRIGNIDSHPNLHLDMNSWGQLLVCRGGGDTIAQMYFNYDNNLIFTRAGNPSDVGGDGSWTEWNCVNHADTVDGYHASDFLKITGGTLTGVVTCNDVSGGMWIYGKTKSPKLLDITTPTVMDSSRYDPLIRGLNTNGDYWNFGLGANNNIGFYGFNSGTTDNRTDWGLTMNITTGKVTSTAGFAGNLSGTASGNLPLSGGTINGTLSMYGSNHIDVRHIDGSTSNGMDGNLYLNYNQPTRNIYFSNSGYCIYNNGANYNGTAANAITASKSSGAYFVIQNNGSSNAEGGELNIQNMDGSVWHLDSCVNKFRIFDDKGYVHFYLDSDDHQNSYFKGTSDMVDGWHVVCNNNYGLKPIAAGTAALTPGTSALSTGRIYLQYE